MITFIPSPHAGWWWDIGETALVPIDTRVVTLKKNQLVLEKNDRSLHTIEHIMVLRWTGLDRVIIKSDPWPPYHGRPQEIWNALRPKTVLCKEEISWRNNLPSAQVRYDRDRTLHFYQESAPALTLKIICDFPKFGWGEKDFSLSQALDSRLEKCFAARPLSFNSNRSVLRWVSYGLYCLGIWKHHFCLAWPNLGQSLMDELVDHRLVDLLGALAMLDQERLPAGRIVSYKGGHLLDMKLMEILSQSN